MRAYIYSLVTIIILGLVACHPKQSPEPIHLPQEYSEGNTTGSANEVPSIYEDTSHFESGQLATDGVPSVFAFGSCNKHNKPQPLWNPILDNQPDAWIWLGDAIYGDTGNEEKLRAMYTAQNAIADYQQIQATIPILGTWDDHDYGKNNGGKSFEGKENAKRAFLDFINIPSTHPVRQRAGIYHAYTMGKGTQQVKIILLDNRSFRDDIQLDKKKVSIPNPEADLLGEAQWLWLENELKNNTAPITIIANGSQVIPTEHRFEKWANHPTDRQRLFKLLSKYCPSGAILLSGDRHHAEVSKVNIKGLQHPLYDITASGLTHSRKGLYPAPESNKYRVGKRVDDLNFGLIKIDWNSTPIQVKLEIRGADNALLESTSFEVVQ